MNIEKFAFVFPGQGSQSVGMMDTFYQASSRVRETYEEAADCLKKDIWKITSEGSVDELNETQNTQPAMLVAGVAVFRVLSESFKQTPDFFAGHSLGEYSALVASNMTDFTTALKLASVRAEAMQKATPKDVGAMAAILGLEKEVIKDACEKVSNQTQQVWIANDNAIGQIVIAGHKTAVNDACNVLKEAGAKRALVLPVSVPSHCPLMQPAADTLKEALKDVQFHEASARVLHNVAPEKIYTGSAVNEALIEQLTAPVRWVDTINYLHQKEVNTVVELGPGKVLAGLNKRIVKDMQAVPINDYKSMMSWLESL